MSSLPSRTPIDIDFVNLSYVVPTGRKKDTKVILQNVSGKFRSGRLTAIMGPSGAGKTTLMNIAAAYRMSHVQGDIYTNGEPRVMRAFRKSSCYIMQDDHHLPHLTVSEAMAVSADLKLGNTMDRARKEEVISEILETLSLYECRNTRTCNLSGGQRKRLSIAVELVNNPPVMFFDEPTSGLDSQNSFQCINLLRSLATEGRTIVCTIHQPSARIFENFDYLYALSEGNCIYRGAVKGLLTFLSSLDLECPSYHNPADFLIEVVATGDYTKKLCNAVLSGKCNNLVVGRDKPDLCARIEVLANDDYAQKLYNAVLGSKCAISGNDKNKNSMMNSNIAMNSINESGLNSLLDNGIISVKNSIVDKDLNKSPKTNDEGELQSFLPWKGKDATIMMASDSKMSLSSTDQKSEDLGEIFQTTSLKQFYILLKRNYVSIMRDSMLTKLRLISHIVVGLLIGALYYDIGNEASKLYSNNGFIFCSVLFIIFAGMMPTLLTFPLEMKVFMREHHNCWYSLKAYYLAKTMADFPFQILYPLIYVIIVYFMTNQPMEVSRFFMFSNMCILTSLVAQSLALVIGAAMEIQEATFFAPIVSIPILLFSGFFIPISSVPFYMRWITYFSYMRYGFEGCLLSIYGFERELLHCSQPFCPIRSPDKFLSEMEINGLYWQDCLALCIFFIILRVIGCFVLSWKLKADR